MKADYVYRNKDDTRRVRVFRTEGGTWDFDVFKRWPAGGWNVEPGVIAGWGDTARTRKECVDQADNYVGALTADGLGKLETVTEGWPERPPPKVTKDAAVEIKRGQIWRFGSRQLIVDWIKPHRNAARMEGHLVSKYEVGCHYITPSGREVGTMIKHRRSARVSYGEQAFREKFRFVRDPSQETK